MTFQRVAALDELPEAQAVGVVVDGVPLCLVRLGADVRAVHDICSHEQYDLHEGFVWGRAIECALHGSTFDLETGQPDSLPAVRAIPTYAVRVDGAEVLVDVAMQLNDAPVPDHAS